MSNGAPIIFLWLVLGLTAGAALDLLIRSLIKRRDLIQTRCSCDAPRIDLRVVPLWGALARAHCPQCSKRLGVRLLVLEIATAAVFAALAWRFPINFALVVYSGYALVLALVFVVDLEHRLIFNSVTYPCMLLSLLVGGFLYGRSFTGGLQNSLAGGLFAGGLFLALYVLAALLYRRDDALGFGDVKLALLIGLMVGWPNAVAAMLLGSVAGGVIGVFLMVRRRSGRATMPYGTALGIGAIISILWLQPVL